VGLRSYVFLLAIALLGSSVAVLPAVAGSETAPTVNAESNAKACGYYYANCWVPPRVELAAPGTVAFRNATGIPHGVVWSSVPTTPTCSGVPVNSFATSFSGTCSFSEPGVYTFYCAYHGASMSGTITVNPSGTTTTTTTGTAPGGTTNTTQPPGTPSNSTSTAAVGSTSPRAAGTAAAVRLARSQHGRGVLGSVEVPSADAGGRLEVDLLASSASLARTATGAPVRVGRFLRCSLRVGRISFSIVLDAKARRALLRRRRLSLIVKVALTPPGGSPSLTRRSVLLRP
jgi:plastocyanin